MDREQWLKEKRSMAEKRYDAIFAIDYDDKWGGMEEQHKDNLLYFLKLLPKKTKILDAACGTGKYWSIIISEGFHILGIDQSQKMIDSAIYKYPNIDVKKLGLQEMNYNDEFYGIMCIDAMENVFPEDWINVLKNFYKALRKDGYLYFTVEIIDKKEREEALRIGSEMGLPVIEGEHAHEGGYHYYPTIERVRELLNYVKFSVERENSSDGYHHFVVRK
ncbi:class I SAM-dependent methyltransferase [Clostridium frigidicarnis]|uniref:Methyltransferase domain-containing protein n=1 Tax=Clostridium frigidicarnis TaxID=84698 RepID=A0A1I0YE49_9CLOT|nr:class I SAM-dependent methyltransferase [Clostridium frigidicarnis]SFB10503.1 Methyltransferase domain-containing protein [Clostridium frigidicarnis]